MLEPEIPDLADFSFDGKKDFLADMHYANPTRALILAKAMDVLPKHVYILGCQVAANDDFAIGLSDVVKKAIPRAIKQIEEWIEKFNFIKEEKDVSRHSRPGF